MHRYLNILKVMILFVTLFLAPLSGLAVETVGYGTDEATLGVMALVVADHGDENNLLDCQDQTGSHVDHATGHCCGTSCAGPIVDIISHSPDSQSSHSSSVSVTHEYLCVTFLFRPPKNLSPA